MEKFTKRNALTALLALSEVQADDRLVKFCENEIALLDKKNGTAKKPTEKQTQNEGYKTDILDYLSSVAPAHKSIAEIWSGTASLSENAEMTGQRISALLTQLIKAGSVERVEEKRKAYFKVA
jgi:hypothetical protein